MEATSESAIQIYNHTTGSNKAKLELGIPGLVAAVTSGGIKLVHVGPREIGCTCGICKLLKDLKEHPFGDTDSIMALWFLWRWFRDEGGAAGGLGEKQVGGGRKDRLYSARENVKNYRSSRRRLI